MRFVDSAFLTVQAGNGGDGSGSFRREKCVPFGGPDGGDGGHGGSVYFEADKDINTLVDFRHIREVRAKHGMYGLGSQCTGKSGEDTIIKVPVGTLIIDGDTDELIGDLITDGQQILIAKGGKGGLGNLHFKTSTNRSPRKTTTGEEGQARVLRLELKLLADVGLLGLPNAGKSTFIRAVSAAKPKVGDYPFTTLHPNLGVVKVDMLRSFVMADIPGLIEGAAQGLGLGTEFLKHLSRTKLLLHLVDIVPSDNSNPADAIRVIEQELVEYEDGILMQKPRWLVFNKIDCLPEELHKEVTAEIIQDLGWQGKVFSVSGVSGEGTVILNFAIAEYLESIKEQEIVEEEKAIVYSVESDETDDYDDEIDG